MATHEDFARLALLVLRRAGGEIHFSDEEVGEMNLIENDYLIETHHDEYARKTVLRMRLKPEARAIADLEQSVLSKEG